MTGVQTCALPISTLPRVAPALDGAQPRRRQAPAQCPRRLDWPGCRPRGGLLDPARAPAAPRARAVCAAVRAGEIVWLDKACVAFDPVFDLNERGGFRGPRAQDNRPFQVVPRRSKKPAGRILRDDPIRLPPTSEPGG